MLLLNAPLKHISQTRLILIKHCCKHGQNSFEHQMLTKIVRIIKDNNFIEFKFIRVIRNILDKIALKREYVLAVKS